MGSLDVIKMDEAEKNKDMNNNFSDKIILVLDIGTTNLKTSIYDDNLKSLHYCSSKVIFFNIFFLFYELFFIFYKLFYRLKFYTHVKVFLK